MAAHYDLNITQGNSFFVRLAAVDPNGTAFNLTDWNLRGHAKIKFSDSTALVDLSPTKATPYTDGLIDINLPDFTAYFNVNFSELHATFLSYSSSF